MRVLLDTHALLWSLSGDPQLSSAAQSVIEDLENEVFVSSVSAWEIAIKRALGKLDAPRDLGVAIADAGLLPRLLRFEDCERLEELPPLHRDPFDRMLVAQALVDGIPIVTRDPAVARYPVQTIW